MKTNIGMLIKKHNILITLAVILCLFGIFSLSNTSKSYAAKENETKESIGTSGQHQCGNMPSAEDNVKTVIDFGCLGKTGPQKLSPIKDFAYAIIRFLSVGVGIAIVLSIIIAGIQYASSMGMPETTGKAKNRIQHAMIGLFIYIFAFSILQFVIPGGIFK